MFESRARAILRSAEFGFLGVIVRTCRQTPRFCGAPGMFSWRWRRLFQFLRMAGALILEILRWRPWRTSWLIVGTNSTPGSSLSLVGGSGLRAGLAGSAARLFRRAVTGSLW